MIVKFFCYEISTGNIILLLPDLPDNNNFNIDRGDVIYNNNKLLGGVNWNIVNWESSDVGFELDETHEWSFNETTGMFTNLGLKEIE